MDRLNFSHLFYFYVVSKEGSIKDASNKLFVTQPTISDQIKLLEEFWDCRLFERRNRALFLTPQGEVALSYAEKIFDLSNELTAIMRNKQDAPKKSVDIGITYYMSQYFLYDKLLPLFNQDEVTVSITEGERRYLLADLESGKLDLVITDTKDSIASTLDAYKVGMNRTFVVAHKKFRKSKKHFPECLNDIPFFNYTNDSYLKFEIDLFFKKSSLTPRVIGEADDIDFFQVIVESGLAFTIVPEAAKNRLCTNKDVIVLGELEELQTTVWGLVRNSYKGLGYKLLRGRF